MVVDLVGANVKGLGWLSSGLLWETIADGAIPSRPASP
jgi:hypothetical protein